MSSPIKLSNRIAHVLKYIFTGPFKWKRGGGGGGLERQLSKMGQLRGEGEGSRGLLPQIILILTPLKCQENVF